MNNEQVFEYIKEYVDKPIEQVSLSNDKNDRRSELIINHLLSLDNKEVNDWLWNALDVKEEEYNINHSSLSKEAKAFVGSYIDAKRKWLNRISARHPSDLNRSILFNINDDIIGDRVVLRACSKKNNSDLYIHHVETDGDFLLYVTPDSSKDAPASLVWANTIIPHSFYVYLKDSNEEIGVVSLFDHENKHHLRPLSIAYFHYYIYKEFRHKGYAYEAGSLLIDAFFNKKIKNEVLTNRHFITEVKYCEPECLKLSTNSKNEASKALATNLSFIYEGTDKDYKTTDDVLQSEDNYYLDLNRYLKLHQK